MTEITPQATLSQAGGSGTGHSLEEMELFTLAISRPRYKESEGCLSFLTRLLRTLQNVPRQQFFAFFSSLVFPSGVPSLSDTDLVNHCFNAVRVPARIYFELKGQGPH